MKVDAIKNISYRTRVYETNNSEKDNRQINAAHSPSLQLPNYEIIASKFPLKIPSFGGNFEKSDELNQRYVQQIEDARKEIEVLKNDKPDKTVQKAVEENAFYEDFQKHSGDYYNTAEKNANRAQEKWEASHGWWYRTFNQDELYDDVRGKEWRYYYSKWERAYEIKPRYEGNKKIIELSNAGKETKAKRIRELEAFIEKTEKLIDYAGLRRTIDESLSGHGGLNDRIAGYSSVKNKVRKFIESIQNSKDNEDAYVSPCVILYGDTGTGKTTFLRSVESMASDDVEIVRFDNDDSKPFMKRFEVACNDAKQRYLDTQKRTILLMDDAEKYFCMPLSETKYYKNELDEADMEKLEIINKNETNKNVKDFKSILDVLSQIPDGDYNSTSYKSAMSIFITTNHPNLIDRQLIKRPEKMDAYHVGPASGDDLNAVVKFYFKDKEKIINSLKMFKDRPDMESAIDSIPNLDIDAKEAVKENFRSGKADLYNIEPSDVDYDTLTEDIQPSIEEGAYSNVMIKRISFNAFEKYLQNPEDPYQVYFYDELCNTKRDIEPQRYKRYLETANFVNMCKENRPIKNINDEQEFVKLLSKRNKGYISKSDAANLESFLQNMRTRLQALEEKQSNGTISEDECVELEQLQKQDELSKNPEKVKEYLKNAKG